MAAIKHVFQTWLFLLWYFVKMYVIGVYILIKQLLQVHYNPTDTEILERKGLVAMVTGGTEGIGLEIVHLLVSCKVTVFIASQDKGKAEKVIKRIKCDHVVSEVYYIPVDLRSLNSVRNCVNEFNKYNKPLHLLINNAGVMLTPWNLTENGFEEQFQVNYLSHYYLTTLLLDKLHSSGSPNQSSRIINISSAVHLIGGEDLTRLTSRSLNAWEYSPHYAYATSKLAIVLSTYSLAKQFKGNNSNITINCLHPGVVNTGLYRNVHWSLKWLMVLAAKYLFKTPEESARSVAYTALAPQLEGISGCYLDNCKPVSSSGSSYNCDLQDELLQRTRTSCLKDYINS